MERHKNHHASKHSALKLNHHASKHSVQDTKNHHVSKHSALGLLLTVAEFLR